MDPQTLKQLQKVEIEILRDVSLFCTNNNIHYSLGGGNLIGAIRHKGFIPWDDDIDIIMERRDYERFKSLWSNDLFDSKYTMEPDGPFSQSHLNHTKICKNNTLLSNDEDMKMKHHHGIWIDILPFDKIPHNKKKRKRVLFQAKMRLLFTRNYPYKSGGKALYFLSKLLLMLPKCIKRKLKASSEKKATMYCDLETGFDYIELTAPYLLNNYYPSDIFNAFIKIPYEDDWFFVSSEYDTILKIRFGDYMSLPPESERVCRHNPQYISFDTTKE